MWQGFTIALREGIEAFLIVALTLSYLARTGRKELSRAVYAGIAVSVLTCAAAGWLFSKAVNQPLWEGILALTAAALVASLLVYMKRVSGRLKSDIEGRLETRAAASTPARAFWGVFAFTLLMITREGMETALLVSTALFQLKSSAVFVGLLLGLVAAAAIGFLWTQLGKGVDLKTLLNVSAVFLGDLPGPARALRHPRALGGAALPRVAGDPRRHRDPRARRKDRAASGLRAGRHPDRLAPGDLVEAPERGLASIRRPSHARGLAEFRSRASGTEPAFGRE